MLRNEKQHRNGQSMLEYALILGIIVMVMFTMSPMLKRGIQGIIKMSADQIGYQNESDQKFDDSGHMVYSDADINARSAKTTEDVTGVVTYWMNDVVDQQIEVEANLGFMETN